MATTGTLDQAGDSIEQWLRQAYAAERAPRPCRLPAPRVVEVAPAARTAGRARQAPVRQSFIVMLALSATALLLHL